MPDIACGAFYFGSAWAFLKYVNTRKTVWAAVASVSFLAALFSKEMALTLPLVVLLLLRINTRDRSFEFTTALRSISFLFIPLFVYLTARLASLGFLATSHLGVQATGIDWATLGARVLGEYLLLGFVPHPLNAFHLLPIHLTERIFATLVSFAALIALCGVLFYLRKKAPEYLLWFLVFAVMLAPVFYFKGISTTAFLAERYLYVPSLAIAAIIACVSERLRVARSKFVLWAVVAVFAVLTVMRNRDWNTNERLFVSTLQVEPRAAQFLTSLGEIYMKRGQDELARKQYAAALESLNDPRYVQVPDELYRAHIGLGAIAARARNFAEARMHLQKAVEINPQGDWGYLYLGGVFLEADSDYPRAMEYFRKAIELGPLNEVARDYMGIALLNQKNYTEAAKYFEDALRINPTYADAREHLAIANRSITP